MLAGVAPKFSAEAATASGKPALIYINKDFESQEIGEVPYGFLLSGGIYDESAEVVAAPTDSNPDNKAANFKGGVIEKDSVMHNMYYAPVYNNFVISMRFKLNDTANVRSMTLVHGNEDANNAVYLMKGTSYRFLSISNKISIDSNAVYTGVEADKWYKLDLLFNLEKNTVGVYVNNTSYGSKTLSQSVKTVDAVKLNRATVEGSDWIIDDYRTYVSDKVLSDEEYLADLAAYKASTLMPPERYETSKIYDYNKFVFHTLYGEFVMSIGGIRFWKENTFYNLPAPLAEEEGRVIVPMRAFAESFGAKVEWSPDGTLVSYGGNTLRFSEGADAYYVNGKPSKLYHPVTVKNGVSFVQLDVLTHFFGVEYEKTGNLISFTGDVSCEFDWSPKLDNPTKNARFIGLPATVMNRIERALNFRRPSPEEIIKAFNETNSNGSHPRLLFTDWNEVRANMQRETDYKAGVERIINLADSYMDLEPVKYELYDGLRGYFPQQILDRGRNLSFAYKVTGDPKYKDRIWKEIETIYNTFPDFNPGHQLDPGNSIHGLAYVYDWLYDDWNKETELPIIEEIIDRNVLPHLDAAYKAATPFLYGIDGSSSFVDSHSNQPVVINSGLLAAALVFFEKNPGKYADMISTILYSIEMSFMDFAPDGAWMEGGSYWTYTVNALPVFVNNLETTLGTSFNLCDAPGIINTANFPISIFGAKESFKAGDDSGVGKTHGYQLFAAKHSNDYALAKFYKDNNSNYDIIGLANYIFDSEIEASGAKTELKNDYFFEGMQQVTMRSGSESSDTVVFFHGGSNSDSHGHSDTGSFQFDMLGQRWATRISGEDYNLIYYGSYEADGTWNDPIYQPQYYRNKGESKNQVIANYGSVPGDVASAGKAEVVKQLYTDTGAYAIMNLTSNNPVYECALRGIMLNRVTGEIIVEDNYQAKENSDFWWFIGTDAGIEISEDGKSAILTKNNQRIWASIISEGNETFEVLPSKPLSELYPETYGHAVTPPIQTAVEDIYKRLAIHNPSTDKFNVSVAFSPLSTGETEPAIKPEYKPMTLWNFDDNIERASLDSVTVDGKALSGFRPDKYNYNINVMTEKSEIPQIAVTASDEYEIEIVNADTLPGNTTVVLKKEGVIVGKYTFVITNINNTATFLNDKQLPVLSYWASSEPQPENMALNLFDGNLNTKYATDEFGGSVTVDYGTVHKISELKMAFTNGSSRQEYFKIEYSEDGTNWNTAYDDASSSGTTKEHESYNMNGVSARYVRVSFFGNSGNSTWVSVSELCAFAE